MKSYNSALLVLITLIVTACGGGDRLIPAGSGLSSPSPGNGPISGGGIDEIPTVPGTNSAPIVRDDSIGILEDSSLGGFDVLANDSDPDGDALSVVSANVDSTFGQVSVLPSNRVRFDPVENLNGVVSVDVVVTDGTNEVSSNLEIIISPVDDRIIVRDDYFTIVEQSAPVNLDVLENDEDLSGGGISIQSAAASAGEVSVESDTLVYTPPQDFLGTVIITYDVEDVDLDVEVGVVTVEVYPEEGETFRFEWQDPDDRRDGIVLSEAEIESYFITTRNLVTEEVSQFSVSTDSVERTSTNGASYLLTGLTPGFFELTLRVVDFNGAPGDVYATEVVRVGG